MGTERAGATVATNPSYGLRRRFSRDAAGRAESAAATRRYLPLPVVIFLVSLFTPWVFEFGSLRLSPYRLVLLVMVVPCLIKLFSGKAGRVGLADFALLGYCLWCATSLLVLHGFDTALQPSGILFVESMGAYALARCYICNATDFRRVFAVLFWCVAALLPFAIIEAVFGRNLLREISAHIAPIHASAYMGARWGLVRVQSVFEHPILFGVASGMILAPVYLVLGHGVPVFVRWTKTAIVAFASALSMSSGPLTALFFQVLLLAWNWLLGNYRYRWALLAGLLAMMWTTISLLSNQSVPAFLMSHFAFNSLSAYYRILIWDFGSQSVMNNPLFGVGLGEYKRPDWMTSSIDMFWLYHAILYGLPAGILMLLTFFGNALRVAWAQSDDPLIDTCKAGYLIAMIGFFLAGWAVHFWNGTYVLFLFLVGSGLWMLDVGPASTGRKGRRNDEARRPKHESVSRRAGLTNSI